MQIWQKVFNASWLLACAALWAFSIPAGMHFRIVLLQQTVGGEGELGIGHMVFATGKRTKVSETEALRRSLAFGGSSKGDPFKIAASLGTGPASRMLPHVMIFEGLERVAGGRAFVTINGTNATSVD